MGVLSPQYKYNNTPKTTTKRMPLKQKATKKRVTSQIISDNHQIMMLQVTAMLAGLHRFGTTKMLTNHTEKP